MGMDFGFSPVGVVFLIMLFAPNIAWSRFPPKDYEKYSGHENRMLLIFERVGEVLVTIFCLFCGVAFSSNLILIVAFALMLIYELYWVRYFNGSRTMKDMYDSFLGIPLPGASLPVIAVFLLGIHAKNMFLIASAIILAIGHIGIHYNHKKELLINA